jgi:hypothetical protein
VSAPDEDDDREAADDEADDDDWIDDEWEVERAEALGPDGEVTAETIARFVRAPRRSRWFPPLGEGQFGVLLPESGRLIVGRMVDDLRDLLLAGDPSLQRLYPTAYPDDEERNAEYASFAHDQLLMARLEALDQVERTLDAKVLTTAELTAWMQVLNQARLVLGTRLDVSEDDPRDEDPDDPDAVPLFLYHQLGRFVEDMVDALHSQLG